MTDLAADAPLSTTLDPNDTAAASGGGEVRVIADEAKEPAKEPSLRDTIAAAAKEEADPAAAKSDDKAESAKGDEKGAENPLEGKEADSKADDAKDASKGAERGPDGKFAAKQPEGEDAKPDADAKADAQIKTSGHIEPPKNFLPDAKETWRNTPRAVQRDVENTIRTYEARIAEHAEVAERFAPLREYDELVRANGRAGLHETLAEVKQLEDMMERNPIQALNQVLLRAGPRKADGSPINLFELAQHIVQTGQEGYNRVASQPAPQQQQAQPNAEVEALKQQLAQVQQQQLAATVIEPFKRDNPRYEELQGDIAFFLQSGKVPTSLSPSDRLAAAYDMAVRINPASHANDADASTTSPEPRDRAVTDLSGSKSIKSAPGAVSAEMEPERGGSIRDLLSAELKRAKRS